MDLTFRIGTEEIQRAAVAILAAKLNAKIDSLATDWAAKDAAFFTALGQANPNYTVEHVATGNMHAGTIPSLVRTQGKAPPENYPNLCSIAYVARPPGSNDDEGERYSVTLALEFMVKSQRDEAEVNARIKRTLEAAHAVMVEHRSLDNLVVSTGAPAETTGDVWILTDAHDSHRRLFWQGGTLEYPVEKYVELD